MKKIVQRTRRFEKMFAKLTQKLQQKFIHQLECFLEDEFHPRLDTHRLKGKQKNEWSFSLSEDYRAIYTKQIKNGNTLIVFTFIRVGTHNVV